MKKINFTYFVVALFTCSCSSLAQPAGHELGKKTPLVFEFEVTDHPQNNKKEFWIKDKGVYKISYSWIPQNHNENYNFGVPKNLSATVEIANDIIETKIRSNIRLPSQSAATGMDFLTFNASDVGVRIPLTLHVKDVYLKKSNGGNIKGKIKIIIYRFNHRWLR